MSWTAARASTFDLAISMTRSSVSGTARDPPGSRPRGRTRHDVMTSGAEVPLLRVLRQPTSAVHLDTSAWLDLIATARHSSLLPRLALLLQDAEITPRLPERVRGQLMAARPMAEQH